MIKVVLILILIFSPLTPTKSAYCDNTQYAQIVGSGEFLYKYDVYDQSYSNIICLLEKTYYVEVLSLGSDEVRVSYNGMTGYVKPSAIRLVKGIPSTPYPSDIKLCTYNKNCYLRKTPERGENTISILPANCDSLVFLGRTIGENIEDFGQNTWYLVEYHGVKGYVYSSYVSSIGSIFPNGENLAFMKDESGLINPLTNAQCVLIVVLLTLPTLGILYIIFRKPSEHSKKRKVKIKYDDSL